MEILMHFFTQQPVRDFYNRQPAHQPNKKHLNQTTSQTRNSHVRPSVRQLSVTKTSKTQCLARNERAGMHCRS